MANVLVDENVLSSMADKIRVQSGTTNKMKPLAMVNAINANNDEIDVQEELINQISAALDGKSGGSGGGATLPTLTNPGTASDLLAGKQLIDGSGNVITGNHECSGGTDIETYTGTIQCSGPVMPGMLKLVYTDKNLDMQITYPDFPSSFEIVKNSMVFTSGGSCTCISGCEVIDGGMGMNAYKITGNNFVIDYMA